jgi:two-component system sensor histidine kinase KdpD
VLRALLLPANIVMLFLLGVLVIAYYCNRSAGVIAAVLSVALFDFLYVPPLFSFAVNDIQYLLTFAVMLTVALTIGHLTSALRRRADDAEQRVAERAALFELAARLTGTPSGISCAINYRAVARCSPRTTMATFTHCAVRPDIC